MGTQENLNKFKIGECHNVGNCTHIGEKQAIPSDVANSGGFKCKYCGAQLFEIKKSESFFEKYGKKIIAIAAIIVLAGLCLGVYKFISGSSITVDKIELDKKELTIKVGESIVITPKVEPEGVQATFRYSKNGKNIKISKMGKVTALETGEVEIHVWCEENPELKAICKIEVVENKDSIPQKVETTVATPPTKEEPKVEPKKTETKPQQVTTQPRTQSGYGTAKLSYGVYEGPTENGKPSGMGGQIRFTRSYTIDLKKASGETVEVNPGDVMVNVKMKDGRLIQGQLKRTDGSQRWIIIG